MIGPFPARRLVENANRYIASVIAGAISGAVFGGVGGRIVMRIVALIDESAYGVRTTSARPSARSPRAARSR
jgi:hypothetical protein